MKTGTAGWTRDSLSRRSLSNMRGDARRASVRRVASMRRILVGAAASAESSVTVQTAVDRPRGARRRRAAATARGAPAHAGSHRLLSDTLRARAGGRGGGADARGHAGSRSTGGAGACDGGAQRAGGERAGDLVRDRLPRLSGAAEEVALAVVHAEVHERPQLVDRLDALGEDAGADAAREHHEELDERRLRAVVVDALDEGAVELDHVGLHPHELLQPGVAGAGV